MYSLSEWFFIYLFFEWYLIYARSDVSLGQAVGRTVFMAVEVDRSGHSEGM